MKDAAEMSDWTVYKPSWVRERSLRVPVCLLQKGCRACGVGPGLWARETWNGMPLDSSYKCHGIFVVVVERIK